jgi:hypothetical protein
MQDYIIDSINRILVEEINNLRTEGKREHWVDVKNEHYPQSLTEWRLLFGFPSIIIIVGDDKRINETKESIKNAVYDSYDFEIANITSKEFKLDYVNNHNHPSGSDGGVLFVDYLSDYHISKICIEKLLMESSNTPQYTINGIATGVNMYGPFRKYQEEDFYKSGLGCQCIRTGWNMIVCIESNDYNSLSIEGLNFFKAQEKAFVFNIVD